MNVLGIIPARGGSKRLPGKNLAALDGRPLIGFTCEAALHAGVLAAVYVNTDDALIAATARECGVACPVMRPARLAADDTPTQESNRFLLEFLARRGETYDAVMILQPTSPLRTAEDIREALELFEANAPCAVVSVAPVAPAAWLGRIGRDGRFDAFSGQDVVYRLNGAIYLHGYEDYLHDRRPPRTLIYPMPSARSVDIDTWEDLRYAELILRQGAAQSPASG